MKHDSDELHVLACAKSLSVLQEDTELCVKIFSILRHHIYPHYQYNKRYLLRYQVPSPIAFYPLGVSETSHHLGRLFKVLPHCLTADRVLTMRASSLDFLREIHCKYFELSKSLAI